MNELDLKIADGDNVVRLDSVEQDIVQHVMFTKPFLGEGKLEARRVNRQVEILEDVGESTNMVLMPVRQYDGRKVVPVFLEKIEIRDRYVDTERRFFRKTHTGIDDDHFVTEADAHTVHPKFADTAEWYYFDLIHKV